MILSSNTITEDRMKAFEERLKKRLTKTELEEVAKAESLRQDYLHRTGRKEMKP